MRLVQAGNPSLLSSAPFLSLHTYTFLQHKYLCAQNVCFCTKAVSFSSSSILHTYVVTDILYFLHFHQQVINANYRRKKRSSRHKLNYPRRYRGDWGSSITLSLLGRGFMMLIHRSNSVNLSLSAFQLCITYRCWIHLERENITRSQRHMSETLLVWFFFLHDWNWHHL